MRSTSVPKTNVLGLEVGHYTPLKALDEVIALAESGTSAAVAHANVHMVMTARRDPEFRAIVNDFHIVTPDGQPVRWALNFLDRAQLVERVAGMDLMVDICERASDKGLRVFLYGSYPDRVESLRLALSARFPGLEIVGEIPSRFRALTLEEDAADVAAIEASGAQIVFVGMGCPRQERWAHEHLPFIRAVILCVGGAFDIHSGALNRAPAWMQRLGLEWLFRLLQEPTRMWARYARNNLPYLVLLILQKLRSVRANVETD